MFLNKEAPISDEINVGIEVMFRKEKATFNCWLLIQEQMVMEGKKKEGKLDYLMLRQQFDEF